MKAKQALLLCLMLCLTRWLDAQIIFVKENGNGNGQTWLEASGNLQQALANASAGTQVWVAQGTYYPTSCTDCNDQDRYQSFVIPNGVQVYGGFNGSETQLSERNWELNPCILSGDIDQDGELSGNAYHVVYTRHVGPETRLDGFVIRAGHAADSMATSGGVGNSGAAWINLGSLQGNRSNPSIVNCTFENNKAIDFGGAVYSIGDFLGEASPRFTNCRFVNNVAGEGGGAVYNNGSLTGNSQPVFIHCLFENNQTDNSGAAIYNNGLSGQASPVLINCTFKNNRSRFYGGGMYNLGKSGVSSPVLTNCIFLRNEGEAAGGIYNLGSESGNSSPVVTNCTFYGNVANVGACIYNQAGDSTGTCDAKISNSIFWGNVAGFGEVFQNSYSHAQISHSLVQVSSCSELNTGLSGMVDCGEGLVFGRDPVFANPSTDDLHLEESSPGIDIGSNAAIRLTGVEVDQDSLLRIWNGTVDLGAYEYNSDGYLPPVVVDQPQNKRLCEHEHTSFEINAFGTRPLAFQWYKEGQPIVGATAQRLQLDSVQSSMSGGYQCRVISILADTVWSEQANLEVVAIQMASVDVVASREDICFGEAVLFAAQPQNPGSDPVYTWLINEEAKAVGASAEFETIALQDGDEVHCLLRSSEECLLAEEVSSDSIEMSVRPQLLPEVELRLSKDQICEGEALEARVETIHGGEQPSFIWTINDQLFPSDRAEHLYEDLADGDQLRCLLISSEDCASYDTVWSDIQTIVVDSLLQPSIAISAASIYCPGDTLSFQASTVLGNGIPQYEWLKNGGQVGSDANRYVTAELEEGDLIECRLRVSGEVCLAEDEVLSSPYEIIVDASCELTSSHAIEQDAVRLYPNPTEQFAVLDNVPTEAVLSVWNARGQRVNIQSAGRLANGWQLDLAGQPSGLYVLQLSVNGRLTTFQLLLL
ncbi:MAG: T9SS type A sorting domain-containing protein [Bacteroidota bacterium]